jgi:hypothetical protein
VERWTANRCQKEILRLWDQSTNRINTLWAQILSQRFEQTMKAFGHWPGRVYDSTS